MDSEVDGISRQHMFHVILWGNQNDNVLPIEPDARSGTCCVSPSLHAHSPIGTMEQESRGKKRSQENEKSAVLEDEESPGKPLLQEGVRGQGLAALRPDRGGPHRDDTEACWCMRAVLSFKKPEWPMSRRFATV